MADSPPILNGKPPIYSNYESLSNHAENLDLDHQFLDILRQSSWADQLAIVYNWIDDVSFTRARKDISRDFSDGVLCAELIFKYLPRLVELHNYSPSSNSKQKKDNWETLNRKVFPKIMLHISPETITKLAGSKPGVVEGVLWDLKRRVEIQMIENPLIGPKPASRSSSIASVDDRVPSRYGHNEIYQPLTSKKLAPKKKKRSTLGLVSESEASDQSEKIEDKSNRVKGRPTEVKPQVTKNASIRPKLASKSSSKGKVGAGKVVSSSGYGYSGISRTTTPKKSSRPKKNESSTLELVSESKASDESEEIENKSNEVKGKPTEVEPEVIGNPPIGHKSGSKSSLKTSVGVKKVSSSRYGYSGIAQPLTYKKLTPKKNGISTLGLVSESEAVDKSGEIEDKSNEVKGKPTEVEPQVIGNPPIGHKSASKSSSKAKVGAGKVASSPRYGYNGIAQPLIYKKLAPKKNVISISGLVSEWEALDIPGELEDKSNEVKGKPTEVEPQVNENSSIGPKSATKSSSKTSVGVKKVISSSRYGYSGIDFTSSKQTPKKNERSTFGLVAESEASDQSEKTEDKSKEVEGRPSEVETQVFENLSSDPKSASNSSCKVGVKKVVSSSRYGYSGIDFTSSKQTPKKNERSTFGLVAESEASDQSEKIEDKLKEVEGRATEVETQNPSIDPKSASNSSFKIGAKKVVSSSRYGYSGIDFTSKKQTPKKNGMSPSDQYVSEWEASDQSEKIEDKSKEVEGRPSEVTTVLQKKFDDVQSGSGKDESKSTGIETGIQGELNGNQIRPSENKFGSLAEIEASFLEEINGNLIGSSKNKSGSQGSSITEMIADVQEGLMQILKASREIKFDLLSEEEEEVTGSNEGDNELNGLETGYITEISVEGGISERELGVSATKVLRKKEGITTSGSFIPVGNGLDNDGVDDYPASRLGDIVYPQSTISSANENSLFYKYVGRKSQLEFSTFIPRRSSMDLSLLTQKNFNQLARQPSPKPRFEVSTILPPQKAISSTVSISDAEGILEVYPKSNASSMETIDLNSDEESKSFREPKMMDSKILDEVVGNQEFITKQVDEKDKEIEKLRVEVSANNMAAVYYKKLSEIKEGRIRRLAHENSNLQMVISEKEKEEKNNNWFNFFGK